MENRDMNIAQAKRSILWMYLGYSMIILSGGDSIIPLGIIILFGALMVVVHPLKFIAGILSISLDSLSLGLIFGIISIAILVIILSKRKFDKIFIACGYFIIICLIASAICYLASDEFNYISLSSAIFFIISCIINIRILLFKITLVQR